MSKRLSPQDNLQYRIKIFAMQPTAARGAAERFGRKSLSARPWRIDLTSGLSIIMKSVSILIKSIKIPLVARRRFSRTLSLAK